MATFLATILLALLLPANCDAGGLRGTPTSETVPEALQNGTAPIELFASGGRKCVSYVSCSGGFWQGHRCSGNRWCVSWLSFLQQPQAVENNTDTLESIPSMQLTEEGAAATLTQLSASGGRKCVSYVSCSGGFWRGHRCSGNRWCVSWLSFLQQPQAVENNTDTLESIPSMQLTEEGAAATLTQLSASGGRKCVSYVSCSGGIWQGHRCSGNKWCVSWLSFLQQPQAVENNTDTLAAASFFEQPQALQNAQETGNWTTAERGPF